MAESRPAIIFEDETFVLQRSDECCIPGYLMLRLKGPAAGWLQLPRETATLLGTMAARAIKAIELAVNPERVYVLSFCEIDPRLHFHLFPRTDWLLEAYRQAIGGQGGAVNGPLLFEWARKTFAAGSRLPTGIADSETVGEIIGRMLR